MKIKYQWFVGGKTMFWVSIILFIIMIIGFSITYIIDPVEKIYLKPQGVDPTSIKELSEQYVSCYDIKIDKPIIYRFVRYQDKTDEILLGTFHEWNGTYYIDISVDLYKSSQLVATVLHETRHMIVEYCRDQGVIDLSKYTEEIAQEESEYYKTLFNCAVHLLQEKQEKEN